MMLSQLPSEGKKWRYPLLFGGGALLLHTILIIIVTVSAMNDNSFTIGSPLIFIVLLDFPVSDLVITYDQSPFLEMFLGNWFNPGDAARLRLATLFFLWGGLQWLLIGGGLGAIVGLIVKKVSEVKQRKGIQL